MSVEMGGFSSFFKLEKKEKEKGKGYNTERDEKEKIWDHRGARNDVE